MHKLHQYILKEFFHSFLSIFTILLVITSLIFIISLSNVTANISITFPELLSLYLLSLPQVIFIAISLAFFIGAINSYSKFSETQEIIAMFSIGLPPIKILKPIVAIAIILTLINSIFVFLSIPYSKAAYLNIKIRKQKEAKFKFKDKEVSQRFGNWNVFKNKNIYLYNSKTFEFITAKNAKMDNRENIISLKLKEGFVYNVPKNQIIKFSKMEIQKSTPLIKANIFNFSTYFKKFEYLFKRYIPLMLLPISLIFFIPLISFFHPRIDKNHSIAYSIGILVIYIGLSLSNKSLLLAFLIPLIFFISGFLLFKRRFP